MSGSKASKNFVHDQKINDFTRSLQKDSFFTYIKGIDSFRLAYSKVDYKPPAYLFCILLKVETFLENIYSLNLIMLMGLKTIRGVEAT